MTVPDTPTGSRSHPSLPPGTAPTPAPAFTDRLRARWWVYTIWYAAACLAGSAYWAQSHGRSISRLWHTFGYLLICSAALTTPGLVIARSGLSLRSQRSVLLAVLVTAAALIAGTLSTDALWATPPLILLAGNAIWCIETIDRRVEMEQRQTGLAPPPGGGSEGRRL